MFSTTSCCFIVFFFLSLSDKIFIAFSLYPFSQHQDHYILLPGPLNLLPRPGVRLVREPGRVLALERAEEASAAGRRLRLVRHGELKVPLALPRTLTLGQSLHQLKPWAASRYLTLLACSIPSVKVIQTVCGSILHHIPVQTHFIII